MGQLLNEPDFERWVPANVRNGKIKQYEVPPLYAQYLVNSMLATHKKIVALCGNTTVRSLLLNKTAEQRFDALATPPPGRRKKAARKRQQQRRATAN